MRKLLLDTCALLWLASGSGRLSKDAIDAINKADVVYVSAISAWEISLKSERGQIKLPLPALQWFTAVLEQHALMLVALDIDILIAANQLPWYHRDPADRFIIATAYKKSAVVVTGDSKLSLYDIPLIG